MNKKAQVTPFIIIIAVVLILAIAATALIGESTYSRIRLANVADGALISAASSFCQSLNRLRVVNKQLGLAWLADQMTLITRSPWKVKFSAIAIILAANAKSAKIFYDAQKNIANVMAKDLRVKLYEGLLGGGLVDEPEPFLAGEYGPEGLNYTKYLSRLSADGSQFTKQLRAIRSGDWFNSTLASYSFNKSVYWNNGTRTGLGVMRLGDPDYNYESYLRVELNDVPKDVTIWPLPMYFFYLWCSPCPPNPCCPMPGFGLQVFAGISRVDFGSNIFGTTLSKRIPFRTMPFFSRDVTVSHRSRVRITGSVMNGYEVKLEE